MSRPRGYSNELPLITRSVVPVSGPDPATTLLPRHTSMRPNLGKSEGCALIAAILCLAFSATSLVWEEFWKTFVVLFAGSIVLAAYGIFSNKFHSGAVLPLAVLSLSLCFMILLSAALTFADYQSKCKRQLNLSQRTLQNAYEFGCGWQTVFLWLWSLMIVCSAALFLFVGVLGFSIVHKFDKYQRIMGRPVWGGQLRQGHLPVAAAYMLALAFVGVCFVMLMVSSFAGHSSGGVSGVCPGGTHYFETPKHNDVGCCEWTATKGTCCQQSVCSNLPEYPYPNSHSNTCNSLVGLLKCATCHPDSGKFAQSMSNITICDSFCTQIFDACCVSDCNSTTRVDFCKDQFKAELHKHIAQTYHTTP
eukprot:c4318_g1_i1.p1 GENE.c4318_g1_i1~~c4318_g1_i1.p1  ORF type:complete len:362 (-),score=80.53 c4318_g1_i1:316-1401(-)